MVRRVLIIDDEEIISEMIRLALEAFAYDMGRQAAVWRRSL
jgi:DNA-binding response OmpR family regulator